MKVEWEQKVTRAHAISTDERRLGFEYTGWNDGKINAGKWGA